MRIPIQSSSVERASAAVGLPQSGITPSDSWNCYSARKCSGKVMNHKDPHNCKNSGGKSDRNTRTGQCVSW